MTSSNPQFQPPEMRTGRAGDEQDHASGSSNFFDRMSTRATFGFGHPRTMRQAQRPEFYPAVCRPSRRKVRVQRSGDHGELLGAASGTSGPVKVKVVILSGVVASLREAATQSKDPYVLHAVAVESRGPNSFALQARL